MEFCVSASHPTLCPLQPPIRIHLTWLVSLRIPPRHEAGLSPTHKAKATPTALRAPSLGLLHLTMQSGPIDPRLGSWLTLLPSVSHLLVRYKKGRTGLSCDFPTPSPCPHLCLPLLFPSFSSSFQSRPLKVYQLSLPCSTVGPLSS